MASVLAAPDEELDAIRERVASGDVSAASARLAELLAADLPRARRAFETDEALALLRSSPHADAIRARIAAVETAWRAALPESVPAVMFATRPHRVRGGLYVPSTRRFLPVGSPTRGTVAALVVPRVERVLVLTQHGVGDYAGHPNISAAMYPLFGERGSIASAGPQECNQCAFVALPDRMRVRYGIEALARDWSEVAEGREGTPAPSGEAVEDAYVFVRRAAFRRDPFYVEGHTDRDGARRGGPVAGWRVVGNRVERAGAPSLVLGRGHAAHVAHNIVPSPDASSVVVVSNRTYPACSHVVDRVEVATAATRRLASGSGLAAALFHSDGALFLQRGTATYRFAPDDLEHGDPLPEGVGLVAPLQCD
ncbi:MAG: hypothetical protein KF729_28635 [Sandaracinaceae bacterium]|nr:hypothetical protein [Sandaracinaceae bacterium]